MKSAHVNSGTFIIRKSQLTCKLSGVEKRNRKVLWNKITSLWGSRFKIGAPHTLLPNYHPSIMGITSGVIVYCIRPTIPRDPIPNWRATYNFHEVDGSTRQRRKSRSMVCVYIRKCRLVSAMMPVLQCSLLHTINLHRSRHPTLQQLRLHHRLRGAGPYQGHVGPPPI